MGSTLFSWQIVPQNDGPGSFHNSSRGEVVILLDHISSESDPSMICNSSQGSLVAKVGIFLFLRLCANLAFCASFSSNLFSIQIVKTCRKNSLLVAYFPLAISSSTISAKYLGSDI